jgi:hypothetical protein
MSALRQAFLGLFLVLVLAAPARAATDQETIGGALAAVLPGAAGTLADHPQFGPGTLAITLPAGLDPTPVVASDLQWRAVLAALRAADDIPALTGVTVTGDTPRVSGFYTRIRFPGQETNLNAPYPNYGTLPHPAALAQVQRNFDVLRSGLPPDAITRLAVRILPLDADPNTRAYAITVVVGVRDLSVLKQHLGDLLAGPGAGLTGYTDGIAVEVGDDAGRSIHNWYATRSGLGIFFPDPDVGPFGGYGSTLPFTGLDGAPAPVYAVFLGSPPPSGRLAWRRAAHPSLTRDSRRIRIVARVPSCQRIARIVTRRTRRRVQVTVIMRSAVCGPAQTVRRIVSLHGRLGRRSIVDGATSPPAVRYP